MEERSYRNVQKWSCLMSKKFKRKGYRATFQKFLAAAHDCNIYKMKSSKDVDYYQPSVEQLWEIVSPIMNIEK